MPSPIATEKAEIVERYEKVRRELTYIQNAVASQVNVVNNEDDQEISDVLITYRNLLSIHGDAVAAQTVLIDALIVLIHGIVPPTWAPTAH